MKIISYFCAVVGVFGMSAQINGAFTLSSPAFNHNDMIPSRYTCDGENISPTLQWAGAPTNTKSFALIVDDPDAPKGTFVHWVIFNIPASLNQLTENVKSGNFTLGRTSFSSAKKSANYGGPCPPSGTHHYHFKLYALDAMLSLGKGASKQELLDAMSGHILGRAELVGLYKKIR
jgi:Raf kinase inhibitor-like YbhB/YbcL family protein